MTATTTPRRAAFTLIELLVVISIIGILTAIAVGAYFRVRTSQMIKATELTLSRLQQHGLDKARESAVAQAKRDLQSDQIPTLVVNLSRFTSAAGVGDADRDRALVLWTYLRMRSEMPQNFDEARTPIALPPVPTPPPANVVLPVKPLFAQLAGNRILLGSTGQRDFAMESAALLHLIATERSGSSGGLPDEAAGSVREVSVRCQTVPPSTPEPAPVNVKVFTDAFGSPVGFVRWATTPAFREAGNPYAKVPPGTDLPRPRFLDPLDPAQKISNAYATNGWGVNATNMATKTLAYQTIFGTPSAPPWNPTYAPQHWESTVVSAGPNRAFTELNAALGTGQYPTEIPDGTDDLFGYKLRREGRSGDN